VDPRISGASLTGELREELTAADLDGLRAEQAVRQRRRLGRLAALLEGNLPAAALDLER
jgi:hypothetical protein